MTTEKKLISLIEKKLKIRKINIKTAGLGKHEKWDSLAHLNLLLEIEKVFSFKFTMKEMTEINSFKEILSKVKKLKK
tara:strand:+ start:4820 stop:5050 length:231 start_codon:yes stop_codon:yes gene_type:complete